MAKAESKDNRSPAAAAIVYLLTRNRRNSTLWLPHSAVPRNDSSFEGPCLGYGQGRSVILHVSGLGEAGAPRGKLLHTEKPEWKGLKHRTSIPSGRWWPQTQDLLAVRQQR